MKKGLPFILPAAPSRLTKGWPWSVRPFETRHLLPLVENLCACAFRSSGNDRERYKLTRILSEMSASLKLGGWGDN